MSGAQLFEERSATDSSTGLRGAHISLHIVHIHKQPLVLKLDLIDVTLAVEDASA